MKFCGNCGAQLQDTAKFCASCGAHISDEVKNVHAQNTKTTKRGLLIVSVAIILVGAIVVGFMAIQRYNSPEQQAIRALNTDDYAEVLDIVTRNQTVLYSDTLVNKLASRIEELISGYESESLEYGLVQTELEAIEKLGVPGIAEQLESSKQVVLDLYRQRNYVEIYALAKESSFSKDGKTGETIYSYDDQGLLIQIDIDSDFQEMWDDELEVYMYVSSADGITNHSMIFEYDDKNNVTRMSKIHPQSNIYRPEDFYEYRYEHDESGNISSCAEYYGGELSYREYQCTFKWENGLLIQEELSSTDDYEANVGLHCYSYDDKGRVSTYTTTEDEYNYIIDLTYNDWNKVEKMKVRLEGYSEELVLAYNYDNQGNMIPNAELGIEIEYDDYGNIITIQYENGGRIEYEYLKMLVPPELIWHGGAVAAIRQQEHTEYYAINIPGWNHVACIYGCG